MELYLAEKVRTIGVREFFRLAHLWKFNRDVDTTVHAEDYERKGEIPPYVRLYVRFIQEREKQNVVQRV